MKNYDSLSENFYDFIQNHENFDPTSLILSLKNKNCDFPITFAADQIALRRKNKRKLPFFLKHKKFIFPDKSVGEQSSNQAVAAYHASLIGNDKSVLDLTAGLGIDALTIAAVGNEVIAVEMNEDRAAALIHNSKILGISLKNVINDDSIKLLNSGIFNSRFDYIFVDPARRDSENNRKFLLSDSLPDIISNFPLISGSAHKIMVKASPLMDIRGAATELPGIAEIHIVCFKGECKEVLLISSPEEAHTDVSIKVIDITNTPDETDILGHIIKSTFQTSLNQLGNKEAPIASAHEIIPNNYLYDPNAGLHKLNAAEEICRKYCNLKKVGANTDLYISTELHKDFPGRIFQIQEIPDKKRIKSLKGESYDVAVRNYPISADSLRKRLGVKPCDNNFIFGFTALNHPMLALCQKVVEIR